MTEPSMREGLGFTSTGRSLHGDQRSGQTVLKHLFAKRPVALVLVVAMVTSMLVTIVTPAEATTPVPQASLSVPESPLIGSSISFTTTFENTAASAPGYGPYIDLFMPVQGTSGDPDDADQPADGITLTDATYLGVDVNRIDVTLACDCSDVHPFTGEPVNCPTGTTAGDVLHVLELPFGLFTATQPPTTIDLTAGISELATLGEALPIHAQAGFRFGSNPLDDPANDLPILQTPPTTAEVTPAIARLEKRYDGPEDETATGPNFPRT